MNKLLLFLLLLPFGASAQLIQKNTTYGMAFNRTGADTLFYLPVDTFTVPTAYRTYNFMARKGTTLYIWNTSTFAWQAVSTGGGAAGWELTGNALTAGQFLGSTNSEPFIVKTNNTERMRVLSGGNVGIGTSTPTHKFQVFGGASKFDSIIISNGTSDEDYMIRHRTAALAFPIVTFKPIIDNKNIAFDIMPRGAPGNYSDNGIAWMDVCDTDVSDGAGAVGTARIGISTTAVEFGSRAFSGASAKPVNINVNTDTRITLSTSNTATFNIGKITQSQSVNADYVGYSLLNTNNTGVGSDAIMFIGNDFGSSRFGFLRWNNNAAVATAALRPNSLQIATNDGATGGIAFGAFGGNGKFTWSTGSGVLITEKMRLDSAGNVGIGTSTPDSLLTVQNGFWAKRGVRLSGLASSANATDSMMVVNTSNGAVGYRAIPSGGGSTSPAGNFGNLQIGRNGAFATPGSDSLDWESSTGLTSLGNINVTGSNNQLSMFDGTFANTNVNPITWGSNYNEPALILNDFGAGAQIGWGLRAGAMIFYMPNNIKFSVNESGSFPAAGTNERFVVDITNGEIRNNLRTEINGARFQQAQGADVASTAGVMTLGGDGNTFEITGTNSITAILSTNWQNGSEITLMFTSTATLVDGTANSGSDIGFELAGNTNFTAAAGNVVKLVLAEIGGTQRWRETSRSLN